MDMVEASNGLEKLRLASTGRTNEEQPDRIAVDQVRRDGP
jgi:hypothetical protein